MTQDQLIISRYINEDKSDTEVLVDVLEGLGRQNKGYYFSDILEALKKKHGNVWNEQRSRAALKSASHKGYITEIGFKGVTSYRIPPVLRRSSTHHSSLDDKNRSLPLPRAPSSFDSRDKKDVGAWAKSTMSSTVTQGTQKDDVEGSMVDDMTSPISFLSHDKTSAKDTSDEDSPPHKDKIKHVDENADIDQNGCSAVNQNGRVDLTDENEDFYDEFAHFKDYIKIELEKLSKKVDEQGASNLRRFDSNGWEPNLFTSQMQNAQVEQNTADVGDNALESRLAATNDGVLVNLYQQRITSLELELRKKQEVIDFLIGLVDSKTRSSRAKLNCHRMAKGVIPGHSAST